MGDLVFDTVGADHSLGLQGAPMYDAVASVYDDLIRDPHELAAHACWLASTLQHFPLKRVIDAAAGTGAQALVLAELPLDTLLCNDASPGMLAVCQARLGPRAHTRYASDDWTNLGAGSLPGSWDGIVCLGNSLPILGTTGRFRAVFARWATLLAPGGILLIDYGNFGRRQLERRRNGVDTGPAPLETMRTQVVGQSGTQYTVEQEAQFIEDPDAPLAARVCCRTSIHGSDGLGPPMLLVQDLAVLDEDVLGSLAAEAGLSRAELPCGASPPLHSARHSLLFTKLRP